MVQTRKSKGGVRPPGEPAEDEKPIFSENPKRGSAIPDRQMPSSSLQSSGFDPSQPILFESDSQGARASKDVANTPAEVYSSKQVIKVPPRSRPKSTLRSFLATLSMLYLGATYFLYCHNTEGSEHPICKAYYAADESRTQVLNYLHTYAKPHLDRAHAYADPYVEHVRPHYDRATNLAKPYASSAQKAYTQHVHPQIANVGKQASAAASPYLDKAQRYHSQSIQPEIQRYQQIGKKLHADHIQPNLRKGQAAVQPHLDYAQKVLAPAAQRYYEDVAVPYATKSYSVSKDTYSQQIHPRLLSSWSAFVAFVRARILPIFSRMNAVYVQPQFDRVREKMFEARTKKAAADAIGEIQVKEREIAAEEETENLDAFIEELRAEVTPEAAVEEVIPLATASAVPTQSSVTVDAAAQAKLKELVSEKRQKLEAESDRYEAEIEQLAKTERILLVQRLNSLRAAAVRDIPARFDVRVSDLKHETTKMLSKMEKYFDRVSRDEDGDVEEKIADAEVISSKAITKLVNRAEEVQDELEAYSRTHQDKESKAVQQSYEAVHTLVATAQEVLGNGWTWLHDVSVDDWSRYHQLQKREDRIHGEYRDLTAGKAGDSQLDGANRPFELLVKYQDEIDDLVDGFETVLFKTKKAGLKRLRGSYGDSVRAAFDSAKSVVGMQASEPTPSDLSASAASVYSVASQSVATAYSIASDSVGSVADAAASSASSLYSKVAENLPGVDDLSSSLHDVTRTAIKAVGGTPSPEGAVEHAESVYARASQVVAGPPAASGVSASAASMASVLASSGSSAAAAAGSAASSLASQLHQSASSALPDASELSASLHQATRIAIRAAGATVSPEGVGEHASSLYARASEGVVGAPEPAASSVSSVVSSAGLAASSYASSVASVASVASESASSLADVGASGVRSAASRASASGPASAESVGSAVSSAGSAAASVVGEHAQAAYAKASEAVAGTPAASGVSASISSLVHEATRSAVRAVGGEPSPEGPGETLESVGRAVSRQVVQATQGVDEAVARAKEAAERVRARLDL